MGGASLDSPELLWSAALDQLMSPSVTENQKPVKPPPGDDLRAAPCDTSCSSSVGGETNLCFDEIISVSPPLPV